MLSLPAAVRLVAVLLAAAHASRVFQEASVSAKLPGNKQDRGHVAERQVVFDLPLELTFPYPAGRRKPTTELFDVRPEVCMAAGGARHGDIVLTEDGAVGTVIGSRLDEASGDTLLWCHMEGDAGARALEEVQLLRVVSKVSVPKGGLPCGSAPSSRVQWLVPTFHYKAASLSAPEVQLFDTRDDVCFKVGGFRHGQVLKHEDAVEMVVIGVRKDESSRTVSLWAQPMEELFARSVPFHQLSALRWVSTHIVAEHAAPQRFGETPLHRTFVYALEEQDQRFDIRPEVCTRIGGVTHGDIVLVEDGRVATAIGVQQDADGVARMWLHVEGTMSAQPFLGATGVLRVIGKLKLTDTGLDTVEAPSRRAQWLQPSFRYMTQEGLVDRFDVRDGICLSVGGFRHGEVLRMDHDESTEFVVIGVQRLPPAGPVGLFVSRRDNPGAVFMGLEALSHARAIGLDPVEEVGEPCDGSVAGLVVDPSARRPSLSSSIASNLSGELPFRRPSINSIVFTPPPMPAP